MLIGKLYAATRLLLPGISIHACYNTTAVIVALKSPLVLSRKSLLDIWPASWWFGALMSGRAGAWLPVRSVDALHIGPANKSGVN
ncbi:hypothetical protein LGM43_10690 [Burkholderia seminalis]|uniref:hypothetical protein n=1 Tax=Burkholderia seminalis TaxID=488731 RepID=UPI001CF5BA6F|nr:hypothetical protein [Burkholderia seminalis]MCA7950742.1 hypothetical protein [Burkholderia seminalis]